MKMTVQEIKELMEAFHHNNLGKLEICMGEVSLKLEGRKIEQTVMQVPMTERDTYAYPAALPTAEVGEDSAISGNVVASPIVGTFYEAPGPDKAPFVQVGSKVRKGDVLFIIESMKLMNEVTSEFDGTVSEIFVKNEEGVEFGQPILAIS